MNDMKNKVKIATEEEIKEISRLFKNWEETLIYSCLSGIMGQILTVEGNRSACAFIGDFCFLAGEPEESLLSYEYGRDFLIVTPQNEKWEALVEKILKNARRHTRYSIKKDTVFNTENLEKYASSAAEGFEIAEIDEKLYNECMSLSWCRDFVCNYPTYEDFKNLGVGIVALKNGEIAAGASSHTTYPGGIEIEIDTKEEYRRNGLATTCGAALILKCLEKGLYPSWDAHDLRSVALAEKLGYTMDKPYTVFILEK